MSKRFGNNGKEKLAFNRKNPLAEPGLVRDIYLLRPVMMRRMRIFFKIKCRRLCCPGGKTQSKMLNGLMKTSFQIPHVTTCCHYFHLASLKKRFF